MRKLIVVLVLSSLFACKKETECPLGYTGGNCNEELTPTSMRITKITVTNFPATDTNGGGWDLLDGPDIYVELQLDGQVIYKHDQFYEDANPNNNYEFIPNRNVNIDRPTNNYKLGILDFDDGLTTDDVLGVISFTPYQRDLGFPTTANLSANGSDIRFVLELTYDF